MTVRQRLLLTIGGIVLLLALPAVYGVLQLERLSDLAQVLEQVHARDVEELGQVRASVAEIERLQQIYVAQPEEATRLNLERELGLAMAGLRLLERSGYGGTVEPAQDVLRQLEEASRRIESLVRADQTQVATDFFVEEVRPLLDSARRALNNVRETVEARGQDVRREAQAVSESAAQTTLLVVAVALLLTLILGYWTTDALSRPLSRLSDATALVADGDFTAPEHLPYDRSDEIGHLSRSFGAMTTRLAELDRLKAEFVSLATHELKTPINVIGGYAELLDEGLYGELEPKQSEIIGLIQDQTRSLTRLVNQLLDLSRFEAGGMRIEPQPIRLPKLLSEVEGSFRALATQKQIDFDVVADESLPETVVLDHDRIRHEVLGNLLSNAFKFTPSRGHIGVRAWQEDGRILLEVRDTGQGIADDQIEHIFEKYYQVGREARAQGSGLGLAIAKQVVEAHHGEIQAWSREGEGTRFLLTFSPEGPPAPAEETEE